ncbi:MAG: insulinase family protein, partial [Prevotella sp.]|nr:insulinase family protein [Prevotella sp.]
TPLRKNPAPRPRITVADNATPIVAIGSDAELSGTTLRLSFKYDPQPREVSLTFEGKKDEYLRNMIVTMLNVRMADLMATGSVRQGEGITFSDGDYSLARTKKALTAIVSLSDNSWQSGMKRIVYELKRTMEHGFSVAEYQRAVSQLSQWLASVERQQASGRGQMESNNMLVQKCMAHFLHGRPLLSNVGEAKIYRQLLQSVGIADINARFSQLVYGKGGLAILLQMPKKGDTTESDVLRIYGDAWTQTTVAHKIPDREPKPVLMPQKPQPGTITEEYHDKQYGTLELTLSNGARVVLKHNDTGRDEIRLSAISNGGTSLMADADYNNFSAINTLPALGGLAHLSGPQLGRALEGSSATYQVSVTATSESFSGSCKAADAEHLLQLLYLRFTTVRKDTAAFERWKQSKRSSLQKSIANPMTLYGDTLRNLMYGKHPRNRSIALALADSVDYDRTCQLFLERFANAADFTFIFVGNVSADSLKPLICQYIASLPSAKGVKEQPNLAAMPELAKGSRKCRINVPMQAPRTSVVYNIMEKCRYNVRNNIACAVLNQVMDSRCTE